MKNCLYVFLLLNSLSVNPNPPVYDPHDALILEMPQVSDITIEELIDEIKEVINSHKPSPPDSDQPDIHIIEICGD